jgi:hypothetical protein
MSPLLGGQVSGRSSNDTHSNIRLSSSNTEEIGKALAASGEIWVSVRRLQNIVTLPIIATEKTEV